MGTYFLWGVAGGFFFLDPTADFACIACKRAPFEVAGAKGKSLSELCLLCIRWEVESIQQHTNQWDLLQLLLSELASTCACRLVNCYVCIREIPYCCFAGRSSATACSADSFFFCCGVLSKMLTPHSMQIKVPHSKFSSTSNGSTTLRTEGFF